jgi:hypothetical protein
MSVIVISDTIQEFNGVRYYLCDKYFQHKGKRLHRAVWEHHNGPIPKGFHVHHKTHDRSKNDIEDLELLPKGHHLSHHSKINKSGEKGLRHMLDHVIPKAAEWHKTEAAKSVHSRIGKIIKQRYEKQCEVCGTTFTTAHMSRGKFCGGACKAKNLRRTRREGKTD